MGSELNHWMLIDRLILKIKRENTPLFRWIRTVARVFLRPSAPRIPGALRPILRLFYELHFAVIVFFRAFVNIAYRNPLFQARCASAGRNLSIDNMPFVVGHAEIHVGDNVLFGGNIVIVSGRFLDRPQLVIKDRSELGWNVQITVNSQVIIEEDVRVSYDCRISDSDGHPREADLRAQNAPVKLSDIRPVRLCRNAWIGNGSHIMKGVTVGEGAIIGANSVVISDVPPYCLALGNPAEVFFRNYGKPAAKPPESSPPPPSP